MPKRTLQFFQRAKAEGQKFSGISLYDASLAKAASDAGVDYILVGDTLGQLHQGHDSTVPVTMEHMLYHTQCVLRQSGDCYVIGDLPYMSYGDKSQAFENAASLMRLGVDIVKLECAPWTVDIVGYLCERGIPVCAHIGLTPQTVHALGGYKVQGRTPEVAQGLAKLAHSLEKAGASMLLTECIPSSLANDLTTQSAVPVIGIGCGAQTDGQVLVAYDLLGLTGKNIRFVKNFLKPVGDIQQAFAAYAHEVQQGVFPSDAHAYL